MNRLSFAGVAGFVFLAAGVLHAQDLGGQPGAYTVSSNGVALVLMPELKTAKPPKWLKPGMVLTWYGAVANIPGARIAGLVQDPDGQWRDPSTGKTYRQDEAAGASGHGYAQLGVLAVHDDVVVVDMTIYAIDDANSPPRVAQSSCFCAPGGALSDYWMNPDVLAKHTDIAGQGILSKRTPYDCSGQRYDALWTSTQTDAGSTTYVTDLATGLVLHTGIATYSEPSTVNLNGVATNVGGATSLSQTTFQGMRQAQIPWAGAPLPPVIANVRALTYQGTTTMTVPGGLAVSGHCISQVKVTGRGKDFLQAQRTVTTDFRNGMNPTVTTADLVTSSNELMPWAIPPEHLANLRRGQILDHDPVTKNDVTISFVGRDQNGNDVAVISSSAGNGTAQTDCAYDLKSGILTAVNVTDPIAHTQSQMFLAGKE